MPGRLFASSLPVWPVAAAIAGRSGGYRLTELHCSKTLPAEEQDNIHVNELIIERTLQQLWRQKANPKVTREVITAAVAAAAAADNVWENNENSSSSSSSRSNGADRIQLADEVR